MFGLDMGEVVDVVGEEMIRKTTCAREKRVNYTLCEWRRSSTSRSSWFGEKMMPEQASLGKCLVAALRSYQKLVEAS